MLGNHTLVPDTTPTGPPDSLRMGLLPAPFPCFPSFRAGVLGKRYYGKGGAPNAFAMRYVLAGVPSMLRHKHAARAGAGDEPLDEMCGPATYRDDGLLVLAGAMLLLSPWRRRGSTPP